MCVIINQLSLSNYTYDWNDRLSSVDQGGTNLGTYTYTDARQRLSKTVGTSTNYYINNNVEYDGDYTNHVFAGVNRVLTSDIDGLHYTHKDHLQSTSLTTDSNGIVKEAVDYKAFGLERNRAGSHESDFGYTDQERDSETGLMYYDSRYYSPELKRFTSVDPWQGHYTTPQSLNKYSYTVNNPIKYNDPTGEAVPILAYLALGAAGGTMTYNTVSEVKRYENSFDNGTFNTFEPMTPGENFADATINAGTAYLTGAVPVAGLGLTTLEYMGNRELHGQNVADAELVSTLITGGMSRTLNPNDMYSGALDSTLGNPISNGLQESGIFSGESSIQNHLQNMPDADFSAVFNPDQNFSIFGNDSNDTERHSLFRSDN